MRPCNANYCKLLLRKCILYSQESKISVVAPCATLNIYHNSRFLNFGQCSTFDLDDMEGHVIPIYKGFPRWGVHFWSYILDMGSKSRSNQRSKVKYDLKSKLKSPLLTDYMSFIAYLEEERRNTNKKTGFLQRLSTKCK